jgi:ABC-type Zn uptake system ZnuABC Zn-binding protein ZnuA
MKAQHARVVLFNSYQPARTAESVAEAVKGRAVLIAHMPDSTEGTSTYIQALAYNVGELVKAFEATGDEERSE